MEYAVISVTDGNNVVRAEHIKDIESARKQWHHYCEILINSKDFSTGMVKLLDENLDLVENKLEYITHDAVAPAPVVEEVVEEEPEEEPVEE